MVEKQRFKVRARCTGSEHVLFNTVELCTMECMLQLEKTSKSSLLLEGIVALSRFGVRSRVIELYCSLRVAAHVTSLVAVPSWHLRCLCLLLLRRSHDCPPSFLEWD